MQTAVSIVALVLSALSLGWQAATHFLTSGRVKIQLRVGAMDGAGTSMITVRLADFREEWPQRAAEQGYPRPVIVVRVRIKGRTPVTVERWGLAVRREDTSGTLFGPVITMVTRPELVELTPTGDGSIGPDLPQRMETGGASATWAVDAGTVYKMAEAAKAAFNRRSVPIVGKVELGDGRIITTRQMLRL